MSDQRLNVKAIVLAGLTAEDAGELAYFDCGDSDMNEFLREESLDQQMQNLSKTYLLYYMGELAAFCSICADSIKLHYEEKQGERLSRNVAPAIKIARLGRDIKFSGLGLGRFMISYVASLARELSNSLGIRYITIDAYPDKADYYRSIGFVPNEAYRSHTRTVSMRVGIYDI